MVILHWLAFLDCCHVPFSGWEDTYDQRTCSVAVQSLGWQSRSMQHPTVQSLLLFHTSLLHVHVYLSADTHKLNSIELVMHLACLYSKLSKAMIALNSIAIVQPN